MRAPIDEPIWYAYPGMVAVVTAQYEGEKNAMSSGWHTYIGSSPGMYTKLVHLSVLSSSSLLLF